MSSDPRDHNPLPDLRYIRELAKVFRQYDLDEIEIENGEQRVLLRRSDVASGAGQVTVRPQVEYAPVGQPAPAPAGAPTPAPARVANDTLKIKSR
jgi:acetyl-CoA carboxylase biotin carboxyl carrier protein